MKKATKLMATTLILLLMGCAQPGLAAPPMATDDGRFLSRSEPVLGLHEDELREALGNPMAITRNGCMVPYQKSQHNEAIPVAGDAWSYVFEGPAGYASLSICIVKGFAVGELRKSQSIHGSRLFTGSSELLDRDLVEKAFKGELDDSFRKERTDPPDSGPKYEI